MNSIVENLIALGHDEADAYRIYEHVVEGCATDSEQMMYEEAEEYDGDVEQDPAR